jgi:subtilisin-like proprotein convertase family protein
MIMKKSILLILFVLTSFLANSQTFSTSTLIPIPDNGPQVSVPVVISGLPSSINSSFGFVQVCMEITHTWDADLEVRLKSPDNTNIILFSGVGGSNDNFTGTCLANNGNNGFILNAGAPFTGNYIPFNGLNVFNNNQDPNGTWELLVRDTYAADTGSIHFVSITFGNNPPPDPGPPPVICSTCACPNGAATCPLMPDMTSSALCIIQQMNETPGFLDIGNATPNIGWGPLEVHGTGNCFCDTVPVACTVSICPNGSPVREAIYQTIYTRVNNNDTLQSYDVPAGFMSFHQNHGHMHVDNWASFTIRQATSNPDATTWPILATGTKQSFCLINLSSCTASHGYCVNNQGDTLHTNQVLNGGFGVISGCGRHQGIYSGMLDIYAMGLNDPIPLNGLCNGNYYLVSITDPDSNFVESDETNNWVAVPITLTQQMAPPSASFNITQNGGNPQAGFTAVNLVNATSFYWDFGDGNVDSTNNPVIHTYTANGTYIVTFTVNSPCGTFTVTDTVVVTTVSVSENLPASFYVSLIPNPVNEKSTLKYYSFGSAEITDVTLFDIHGKEVTNLLYDHLKEGYHQLEINVKSLGLNLGVYLLRIKNGKQVHTLRLIII